MTAPKPDVQRKLSRNLPPAEAQVRIAARFWSRVKKGDGCWLWCGTRSTRGYGQFTILRKPSAAHRVAWELVRGPIPEGVDVCHHCDNPPCVNPDHLFIGTRSDNMRDAVRKGRLVPPINVSKSHCRHGHALTPENSYFRADGSRSCRECGRIRDQGRPRDGKAHRA